MGGQGESRVATEGQAVGAVEEDVLAGADLLEKIPGKVERIFRNERQQSTKAKGAETVRVDAGAEVQAQGHVLVHLRERVDELGPCGEEMRLGAQVAVAGKAERGRVRPELAVVEHGQLKRDIRGDHGLAAPDADTGADIERGAVVRDGERRGRPLGAFVDRVVHRHSPDAMDGQQLVRVEEVIDRGRDFGAVPVEAFFLQEFPLPDLRVAVAVAAPRESETDVRVLAEQALEADLGVDEDGRNGQAERHVRPQPAGLVVVVEGVGRDGRRALERLVVADLDQLTRRGIDLRPDACPAEQGTGNSDGEGLKGGLSVHEASIWTLAERGQAGSDRIPRRW